MRTRTATVTVRINRRMGACGRITRSGWVFMTSMCRRRLAARAAAHLVPPARKRRRAPGKGQGRELQEGTLIHPTLEVDALFHRVPEARPPALVELRLIRAPEIKPHRLAAQPQKEPALLLADAHRLLVAAHVARRQPVAQPASGVPEELDISLNEPDLLVELAENGLLETLALAHAALRKLPAAAARAPAEEDLARAAHQHDADIRAKAIRIDDISGHVRVLSSTARSGQALAYCSRHWIRASSGYRCITAYMAAPGKALPRCC